jgi:hypothetical protein
LNILRKEGFCKSASTKERRFLKTLQEDKGESVEELIQAQGVHQGHCKFILQSSGGKALNFQEGKRKSTKGCRELITLEVFKPSKVTEESKKNSTRSAEEVREKKPKSRKEELH